MRPASARHPAPLVEEVIMKPRNLPIAAAIAAVTLGLAFATQAQTSGEDRAAPKAPSTEKRADVKKAAIDQTKAGKQAVGECDALQRADAGACKKEVARATAPRAQVKAEAAAANKAGQTKAGEMSEPQKKDEGVKK
jgi:hypothetical protein